MPDNLGLLSQRAPRSSSREGRVLLIAEVADALLRGELPSVEARLFVGAALESWLRAGGAFEKHARVGAPRGSHHRPHVLYARLIGDERQGESDRENFGTDHPEPEGNS